MALAREQLLQPSPENTRAHEDILTMDNLPWYFAPEKRDPDDSDIHEIAIPQLRPDIMELQLTAHKLRFQTDTKSLPNGQRKIYEGYRSFSTNLFNGAIEAGEVRLGTNHDEVDTDVGEVINSGQRPVLLVHEHERKGQMHPADDHIPAVIETSWGRVARVNMVVSGLYGETPTMYLSIATQKTPLWTPEEWRTYTTYWKEQLETAGFSERQQLEGALQAAYTDVAYTPTELDWGQHWNEQIRDLAILKERSTRGVTEYGIWEAATTRLRHELNGHLREVDSHPRIAEAKNQLQAHMDNVDQAVRLAAAQAVNVVMMKAEGWDMKFHKLGSAA